jgi:hypothetical protein
MQFIETSLTDLYKGTVKAFPKTTLRQYATDTVRVERLEWVPFLGMKTLFIKGIIKNEGRKYESIILFKNINYKESEGKKVVKIKMSTGKEYFVEQIESEQNDVLVNCQCKDFYWRFKHFNKLDKSLYGRDRRPYKGFMRPDTANPMEMAGMCKHLIKMAKIIKESNLLI